MLRSLRALEHYLVCASDGDVASVRNFLIDDERWLVRHLVLKSSDSFGSSNILISPMTFRKADWTNRRFHVALSLAEVKHCPSIEADPPVALQHERGGPYEHEPYSYCFVGLWGQGPYPGLLEGAPPEGDTASAKNGVDAHLRSTKELRGYRVHSDDSSLGSVGDFLVDDATWQVRYVVVDAGAAWSGEKLFIATGDVRRISWTRKTVFVQRLPSGDGDERSPSPHGTGQML